MAPKEARNGEDADVEEVDEEEPEESGISINITAETITIDVPRDGNEGETLNRLAKMVDGLG